MVPTVSIGYFFMGPSGQEEAQGSHTLWIEKDPWTLRVADLDWLGLRRLVLRIRSRTVDSRSQAGRSRVDATVEFVEEHQSNGTIEVAVREIQKQVRVMKSSLEERMKCEVPCVCRGIKLVVMDAQLTSCMLSNRTADSWLNLENECILCRFDLEGQNKRNWIQSGNMSIHRYQRSQ